MLNSLIYSFDSVTDADFNKKKIIDQLNFKSEDDALPFFNLPVKSLLQVYKTTKNDEEKRFCTNRLYYLSDRLEVCVTNFYLNNISIKKQFIYKINRCLLLFSVNWLQKGCLSIP